MIPSAIRPAVEAALEHHFGRPAASLDTAPVGGGCISPAARVRTAAGDLAFLKWAEPGTAAGMFVEEARCGWAATG